MILHKAGGSTFQAAGDLPPSNTKSSSDTWIGISTRKIPSPCFSGEKICEKTGTIQAICVKVWLRFRILAGVFPEPDNQSDRYIDFVL